MYFVLAEMTMEYLSSVYVKKIFMLQNVNIKNVMNTVPINNSTRGGKGDSFNIDAIVSGARTSAIEKVIT
jgi:hypothetical protein